MTATSNTLSQNALLFLRVKLHECRTTHTNCQRNYGTDHGFYPARLLKVRGRTRSQVQLVDTDQGHKFPYFTLSHCWGDVQPLQLNSDTEQDLRAGFDIQNLPPTFKQAIEICRELDMDYLWIDSLCIYQDRLSDWHAQAAFMQGIYTQAVCNIAATSAWDSTIGLRFTRNPIATVPFQVTISGQSQSLSSTNHGVQVTTYTLHNTSRYIFNVASGPLNQRAWVLQESLLSRRIIHFASSGIYWECMSDISSDLYPDGLVEDSLHGFTDWVELKRMLFSMTSRHTHRADKGWSDELYAAWINLLDSYTWRRLSHEADIFVALCGIAQKVADVTGDELICGLWKTHIVPQLLWYRSGGIMGPRNPDNWRAPSWSWASTLMPIKSISHGLCKYARSKATVEGLEVDATRSGQVKSASITIRGKLVCALLEQRYHEGYPYPASVVCLSSGESRGNLDIVCMDSKRDEVFSGNVVCVALYEDTCNEGLVPDSLFLPDSRYILGVLILMQCNSGPDCYRRVGVMFLTEEHYYFYISIESSEETQIRIV